MSIQQTEPRIWESLKLSHYILKVMGGCCCCSTPNPHQKLEDLNVSACTVVKDIAIDYGRYQKSIVGCCQGLMYIRDERLYYKCHCCWKCCSSSYDLKDITKIEVFDNDVFTINDGSRLRLNPGLRIVVDRPQSRHSIVILVQMADAHSFSGMLKSKLPITTNEPFWNRMLLWEWLLSCFCYFFIFVFKLIETSTNYSMILKC